MSYIYIIGSNSSPYKIGFSKEPQKRLKSLQTGHPFKLSLLYTKEVSDQEVKNIEKQIHRVIGYKKSNGEWFNISLEEAISEVNFAVIRYEKV